MQQARRSLDVIVTFPGHTHVLHKIVSLAHHSKFGMTPMFDANHWIYI